MRVRELVGFSVGISHGHIPTKGIFPLIIFGNILLVVQKSGINSPVEVVGSFLFVHYLLKVLLNNIPGGKLKPQDFPRHPLPPTKPEGQGSLDILDPSSFIPKTSPTKKLRFCGFCMTGMSRV